MRDWGLLTPSQALTFGWGLFILERVPREGTGECGVESLAQTGTMEAETLALANILDEVCSQLKAVLAKFEAEVTKPEKNADYFVRKVETGIALAEWSFKKFRLQFAGRPKIILRGDVFYCDLGVNVGSEQNGLRPVVVLQGNAGNRSSTTTIVVPISTHDGCVRLDENDRPYLERVDKTGQRSTKYLQYFEVPVTMAPGAHKAICGCANAAQLRTVSMKRLNDKPIGQVTPATLQAIMAAAITVLGSHPVTPQSSC